MRDKLNSKVAALIITVGYLLTSYVVDDYLERSQKQQIEQMEKQDYEEARNIYKNINLAREWNSSYGGVYVYPKEGQQPNPYLMNNTLRTIDNERLIKINHAWMTRQLAEHKHDEKVQFRLTSLLPLNPINQPTEFEKKALRFVAEEEVGEYVELSSDGKTVQFLGALYVQESCLQCHAHQGYQLGDVRGGVAVYIDRQNTVSMIETFKRKASTTKVLVMAFAFLLYLSVLYLINLLNRLQLANASLQIEANESTSEKMYYKKLMQKIVDTQDNVVLVNEHGRAVFANDKFYEVSGYPTLEAFAKHHECICDYFVEADGDPDFIASKMVNGIYWIDFLLLAEEGHNYKIKLINDAGKSYYLRPKVIETDIDGRVARIVSMYDITLEEIERSILKNDANIDKLTSLLNRRGFELELDKLEGHIHTKETNVCGIFLDIDHFKQINDQFGHKAGDCVLSELAELLKRNVRKEDIVVRWGGEEFVILVLDELKVASALSHKLCTEVAQHRFEIVDKVTVSLGVGRWDEGQNRTEFIESIDKALYQAKEKGRNRVEISE